MAGSVLGATFSLLLLASIIQGFQDGAIVHNEEEAVVGQNATLHCSIKNHTGLKIISVEWAKKDAAKLAIYSFTYGENLFQPNLTLQIKNSETSKRVFFLLHLPELRKEDSGTYICDITTFPDGAVRSEIKLTIEDGSTIECNVQNTVEVYNGENVTIHCNVSLPSAQYSWAKNKNVMSNNESLKLWMVTDAYAGIYTLTVNAGKKTLHKEFIITVLQATTSLRTDIFTVSSQHQTESTVRDLETTVTTITTTTSTNSSITSNVTMAREETTSFPAPRSDFNLSINTSTPSYGTTTQEILNTQTELYTLHTEDMVSTKTEESSSFRYISESGKPDAAPTVSNGNKVTVTEEKVTVNKDTKQRHLLQLLIIIPVLLLITVAGFLYRRRLVKSRMELPPPFKPPPPPVKYTAPRRRETSIQPIYI